MHDKTIIQADGLAMGAPSSSILSESFLQHIEHTPPHLTQKHKLVNYFRYVYDILLIFDLQHTDLHAISKGFNSIHPNLHFTEETEQNCKINYLDITIHKTPTNVNNSIYRKPTFTNTLIPYTSNHHAHHKYVISFLHNRLNYYQLNNEEYRHEQNTIYNILHNTSYPILPQN
jgi:hypothetical protein